jgi:hypothetical protein
MLEHQFNGPRGVYVADALSRVGFLGLVARCRVECHGIERHCQVPATRRARPRLDVCHPSNFYLLTCLVLGSLTIHMKMVVFSRLPAFWKFWSPFLFYQYGSLPTAVEINSQVKWINSTANQLGVNKIFTCTKAVTSVILWISPWLEGGDCQHMFRKSQS